MADPWLEPLLLVKNEDDILSIDDDTAAVLEKVDKPLVVVCIAGPYRTGKSYLMNRLGGRQSGFALGSTVESKTKGIWVWLVDHPLDPSKALLLMDTEGLEDAFRSNDTYDMWICCLAILLSSVFVYNIVGKIDTTTIDKLEFVTAMSKHIRASNEKEDKDKNFDEFFPSFILAVRDFFLKPEINGKLVSSDEYMEHMLLAMKESKKALNQSKKSKEKETERRAIKMKLRSYFKQRSCFFFPLPVQDDKKLKLVDTLPESELEEHFLKQVANFCKHIYGTAPVKKLDISHEANGKVMVMLARQYVESIRKGDAPCVESAVEMISQKENNSAVEAGCNFYCSTMEVLLEYPVSAGHLADTHHACYKQAVDIFLKKAFLDKGDAYHKILQERLLQEYSRIVQEDAKASWKECHRVLSKLFAQMDENVRTGRYICSGGYETYLADLEKVKTEYVETPNKGVKSEEALLHALGQRSNEKITIMKSDEAMTEAEKRNQDELLKAEEARKKLALQQKELDEVHRHQANLLASHEEHLRTLTEAFEKKMREEEEEFERLLQQRSEERKRLLEEKYVKEADELKKQMEELEERKKGRWKRYAGSIANVTGAALSLLPNPLTKAAGIGLGILSSFLK